MQFLLKNKIFFLLFLSIASNNLFSSKIPNVERLINRESLTTQELNYLLNFPLTSYKLYLVPNLGNFYIETPCDGIKDRWLKKGRIWEPKIHNLIIRYTKLGSTAIDIGAFVGSHTIAMSKSVGNFGNVVAFEPCLKSFCECAINLAINDCFNTQVNHFALLHEESIGKINIVKNTEARAYIGDIILSPEKWEYTETVGVKKLDSFNFSNVSLIKIDVEGSQDLVLQGAIETIKNNRPVIIFEANDPSMDNRNETAKFLETLNYSCSHIEKSDWIGIPNLH